MKDVEDWSSDMYKEATDVRSDPPRPAPPRQKTHIDLSIAHTMLYFLKDPCRHIFIPLPLSYDCNLIEPHLPSVTCAISRGHVY